MAKGYSARRGFSNGAGQAAQQMQMQMQQKPLLGYTSAYMEN